MGRALAAGLLLFLLGSHAAADPLQLGIRGHDVNLDIFTVFSQPGETLRIAHPYGAGGLQVLQGGQKFGRAEPGGWLITAPITPGLYTLDARRPEIEDRTQLNLFVAVPATEMQGEYLNGYRIGTYPSAQNNRASYDAPKGFFEVTADNVNTRLSPHFTLGQFLCKQKADYPKYVVVQENLLVLLEGLLVEVRAAGYEVETFGVISGYRTPWYNQKIGNVPNSRHVFGDAMDFYIDIDRDGRMDDLNRDGMHNRADIARFFAIVDAFKSRPGNASLLGGIGHYDKTTQHGGFVHADTRGYRARW